MNGCRMRKLLAGALGVWCALPCGLAVGDDQGSRFDVSPDGARIDFDVRDAPRRDVLHRLFAGTGVEIRWVSPSYAEERISGKFSGTASSVARDLLARTNFVLVREHDDATSRVIRVVVVGPASGRPPAEALAALAAAMPASATAPAAPPTGTRSPTALPAWGRGGEAAGPLKPPPPEAAPLPLIPPGAEAPPLIPPPPDAALPLIPVGPGAAAPALNPTQPIGANNQKRQ